jgi:hypothetical protein
MARKNPHTLLFRTDADTRARLERIAGKQGYSVGEAVRRALAVGIPSLAEEQPIADDDNN